MISPYRVVFSFPLVFKFPIPELWRLFTAFWLTGKDFSILFDTYFSAFQIPIDIASSSLPSVVWTYSSGLEKESGRFTQPGDFFTYILFLGVVILVRSSLIPRSPMPHLFPLCTSILYNLLQTSQICPPSHTLAAAVPGVEEDYPCISRSPIIRNQSYKLGACVLCGHGGNVN